MIVETDFADGQHFRMRDQIAQTLEIVRARFGGIVRMNADGRVEGTGTRRPDVAPASRSGGPLPVPMASMCSTPARERALDHRRAIFVEFGVVQVSVRIDQPHLRRAPTGISSWKPASTGLPPSTDAATIIPFDSMPRSFRGCRLATITTLRFTNSSGV